MNGFKHLVFALCCLLSGGCGDPDTVPDNREPPVNNSLQTIRDDMTLAHEGSPHGVPASFDWAAGPRIGWGNNPPADWLAMIPWGQVYRDHRPMVVTNTRVHLRNFRAWRLSKRDNRWRKWVQTPRLEGAYYREDFQEDINVPAPIRPEAGGGISITLVEGYNFHFWSGDGRVAIDPADIGGVWIAVDARLIPDDPGQPDDRDRANFLLSAGGDYWKSLTAEWDNFRTNGDIAIGRFKYVRKDWRTFNMHTLTDSQLTDNPPPFE